MVQMQTTGAELSKLDDGLSTQVEAASIQNARRLIGDIGADKRQT